MEISDELVQRVAQTWVVCARPSPNALRQARRVLEMLAREAQGGPPVEDHPYGPEYSIVYLDGATVSHIALKEGILCGTGGIFVMPRGTGSQAEYEIAASLPVCKKCRVKVRGGEDQD